MELTAAIAAWDPLKRPAPTSYTDSRYVMDGITQWIHGWKQRLETASREAVKNADLWRRLDRRARTPYRALALGARP